MTKQFTTKPPRWTSDWYGNEMKVRQYIFDTRKEVCHRFWYEQYLCPLVEDANLYKAKSGEDVWWSELTQLTDREWNISDIALRPEMTPSVTRMVAGMYPQMSKPIRLYSIANFYRNERPQRGRNREFRQLNVDMFGWEWWMSDVEILQLALEIMLAFSPPEDSFVLYVSHRVLIDDFLLKECLIDPQLKQEVTRTMDKWNKMTKEDFVAILFDKWLDATTAEKIVTLLECDTLDALISLFPLLKESAWLDDLSLLLDKLSRMWYDHLVQFQPSLMRWFDYYDGLIFEMFDRHPDNNRAMFGWGRYNWLAELFGQQFPAIWMAPWDEPMKLFLESWGMIDAVMKQGELYYIPLLDANLYDECLLVAQQLRQTGKSVELDIRVRKLWKAMQYADKKWHTHIIILGEQEKEHNEYKIKNLLDSSEISVGL